MRFSSRTGWDREANELTAAFAAARAHGPVADLSESNPTRVGLAADPSALAEALRDDANVLYEPEPQGLLPAREEVAAWYAARGASVAASRVVLTASTSEAYALLFKLLCDPGDAVLVPQPSYPLFEMLARLDAVEAHPYRLRRSGDEWRLDLDALASALTERTRAILVVDPNNPTGSMLADDEIVSLARLCRERGLALVSDEVFADFRHDGGAPRSLLDPAAAEGALIVALSGLSKACGLPQLKLGWAVVGGPDALVSEALARLDLVADAYLSVATPVQRGLGRLLDLGADFRRRALARIEGNRATLACGLAATSWRVLEAQAGWSALIELPPGADEGDVARDLARSGVVAQPGWLFDLAGSHLVASLIVEPATLARSLPHLVRVASEASR